MMGRLKVLPRSLHQFVYKCFQVWKVCTHPSRERLRHDPFSRIYSFEEIPIAADLGVRIDVNQATVDDWLRLPGISIHQARTLTTLSQSGVLFNCVEDIAGVLGISCSRLVPLQPLLQFCYYDSASITTLTPIFLNQATVAQLSALPGMYTALVERIVNERQRSPFTNWADFHCRLRLTSEQTAQWIHYLRV